MSRVQAAGGAVLRAPFDVPGVGRICIITDPGGARLGLMTPAAPPAKPRKARRAKA